MPPTTTASPPGLALVPPTDTGPPTWRPRSQSDLAPAGATAKARANLAALRALQVLHREKRPATADEAAVLARWAGWGALPEIFDETRPEYRPEREELLGIVTDAEWRAAALTTLNAHYTSAEVITAMWAAVGALGFTGGRVLEPGCGSGNFIGLAPDLPLDLVGVEVDPLTAAIAAALYPHADIRAQGFEDTNLAPDSFDLVVGNVPFAKVALHDPLHNKARHSVHNHFIIKALRFLRPGALMAVLTSRYTLDSRNPAARREMAELADLVGAVRLPNGAMARAAGTQAIMDLLILRRREGAPNLFATPWASLTTVPCGGDTPSVTLNEYFGAHPDHVLGTLETDQGMYGKDELVVRSAGELSPALTAALADIVGAGLEAGLGWKAPARPTVKAARPSRPTKVASPVPEAATVAQHGRRIVIPPPPRKEGTVLATDGDTGFGIVRYGSIEPFTPTPKGAVAEVAALVQLRDIVAALLEAQASSGSDAAFSDFQEALNQAYDDYVARFGPISRFSTRPTGRIGHTCPACVHEWILGSKDRPPSTCPACGELYAEDGSPRLARIMPPMGGFRAVDPDFPALLALEIFDPETQTAHKAPIFTTRVVAPRTQAVSAETAQDALFMCLDRYGDVRLDRIAELLGVGVEEARQQLGDMVWEDPISHELVTAAAYLSGNIRTKLAEARLAALDDPRFGAHVEALEAVLPADLATTEIDARLGCTWIDAEDVKDFLVEALGAEAEHTSVGHVPLTATWTVGIPAWERRTVSLNSTWGTGRCDAGHLVQFSLNQQPATVYDTVRDGSGKDIRILNVEESMKAREKQEAVEERFAEWIWTDPTRAKRLARIYNDRFNSTVLPVFDGSHLSLPGLSADMVGRVHPHQLNSIWRGITSSTLGLFHPVGAGKTLVMCGMGIEMRRLGLISKPVYVVPNHMLEQFTAEFIRHYPLARVLMATKEQTTAANRKEFVARCAMGDWDGIVITASAFERIPLSAETRAEFLALKMDALEAAIRQEEEKSGRASTKRMQLSLKKLVERHKRLLAEERKDDGVRFEATGIDYIFYDECFPWDTPVMTSAGLLPIGKIVDEGLQVDVLSTSPSGTLEWQPISRWVKKRTTEPLLRISHETGVLTCTPNHRIWVEGRGYVRADTLAEGETLRVVRDAVPAHQGPAEAAVLQPSVLGGVPETAPSVAGTSLPRLRHGVLPPLECGPTLLRQLVCRTMEEHPALRNGSDSQHARDRSRVEEGDQGPGVGRANATVEPDARSSSSSGASSGRSTGVDLAGQARRERDADGAAEVVGRPARPAHGVLYQDPTSGASLRLAASFVLGGPGAPGDADSDRGGRELTQDPQVAFPRSSEDGGLGSSRVVGIEVLERGGADRDRSGRDGGQLVYNLEIDTNHNYFARGVLVSNCHYAKNMSFPSHIQGVGGDGSQRAEDLEAKVTWLRSRHGERVVCLSTATPVANTLAEIFVMQRYLQPDALHEAKIYEFDAWAATFGRTINQIELSPDGSTYRIASRFARFRNVPDLMGMFWQSADILTPETLNLPIPAIAGGEAEVVVVPGTDALKTYMADVAKRAQQIRDRHPRELPNSSGRRNEAGELLTVEDNMLLVSTDGRKAALHLSLVRDAKTLRPLVPDGPDKIAAAAERIATIYRTHRHTRFKDPAGNVADRAGGFQLVFCDLGTPHDGQWSVYGELRGALVAAGVPESGIRYIHEAKDDRAKADLFGACRDGRISVLIASTSKGGVGTNVQTRMVALHHIDCPWRPCDIEQREGRILRQGNQNAVVNVVRYVTESSFDIYLWQTVTRKAAFIYQVMSGKFKGREVDDIGEQALSYAEVTAIATGNPLLLEQAGVNNEVARLTRSRRAHHQDQAHLEWVIDHGTESLDTQERIVAMCEAAIVRRIDTRGERFAMTLHGHTHTVRTEAGEALVMAMLQGANGVIPGPKEDPRRQVVGSLGGFDIALSWQRRQTWEYTMATYISIRLVGTDVFFRLSRSEVLAANPHSLVIQMENGLAGLEHTRNRALVSIDQVRGELDQAQARLGVAFPHETELATLEERAKEIATTLQRQAEEAEVARHKARTEGTAA